MAIYFEKRTYTRSEIGEILGIDTKDKNFKRTVKAKLANLGFTEEDYIYTCKGVTILWVPTEPKEKIIYLVRLLGIDKQVNVHNFAMFLYGIIVTDDLQAMPWEERSKWMEENWDCQVSSRTLRTWSSKLLEKGIFKKEKAEGVWWCSSRFEGTVYREMVESEEEIENMRNYWNDWRQWRELYSYKEVFSKLW